MKSCQVNKPILRAVLFIQLQTMASFSAALGCCGPENSESVCQCRDLSSSDEATCYYNKFNGSEPDVVSPRLISYPLSGTYAEGDTVELICSISYASSPTYCPLRVIWEHNGTAVNPTATIFDASTQFYKSTLKISTFSSTDQGDYMCRVGEGDDAASIASPTASLQLPKFLGWVDRAYSPPSDDPNSVSLTVAIGGSAILECLPNTTESLEGKSPLVESTVPVIMLPSGNVLVTKLEESTDITCKWPLVGQPTRHFHITISPDSVAGDLRLIVSPADRVLAMGSNIELYCIPSYTETGTISWLKDGIQLKTNETVLWEGGQVMAIKGATSRDAGNYTCSVSNGSETANGTASIAVIDPPGSVYISVTGDTSDLIINNVTGIVNVSTSRNVTLLLSCQTDTSSPVHYQWLRGGVPIVEEEGKAILKLSASGQLSGVTESYQCTVTNTAGTNLSQAIWIVKPKPSSPVHVWIRKNGRAGVYFQYDIIWGIPAGSDSTTNYTVETLSMLSLPKARYCSCQEPDVSNTMLAFHAGCFQKSYGRDYNLYYRVAANTRGTLSSFVSGNSIPIRADPPPKAVDLTVNSKPAGNKMNLTLSWNYKDTDTYYTNCYDTEVISPNTTTTYKFSPSRQSSIQVPWKCCAKFEWEVTNSNFVYSSRNSSSSNNYTSPPQSPTAPPQLLSVSRLGTTGTRFSISFKIDLETSCMCGVKNEFEVTVKTNESSVPEKVVSRTYHWDTDSNMQQFQFDVDLSNANCSSPYEISLAFRNSEGRSPFSQPITVGPPTGSNIPGILKLDYTNTSWSSVTVSYHLEQGAECLLQEGALHFNVCYAPGQLNDACSPELIEADEGRECVQFYKEQDVLILPRYHHYCVVGKLWSNTLDMNTVTRNITVWANEGIPTTQPKISNLTSSNGNLMISWSPIPNNTWNGVPYRYTLTIKEFNGQLISTTYRGGYEAHSVVFEDYNNSVSYNISLSACTKTGCGPATTNITEGILMDASNFSIAYSIPVSSSLPPSNQDKSAPASPQNLPLIVSGTVAGVILTAIVVVIIAVFFTCCHRRKKKYDRLREGSLSDIRSDLFEEEPLMTDREPPTGALARSEYTECESLCDGDQRVTEWVLKSAIHRDGYVKDADEELLAQGQDDPAANNSIAPMVMPDKPLTQNSSSPYVTNEVGNFSLQGGSGTSSTNTVVLTSGYSSTVHSANQVPDVHTTSRHNGLLSAYAGIHNITSGAGQYMSTQPSCSTRTNQTIEQQTTRSLKDVDFLSNFICIEEFSNPSELNNPSSLYCPSLQPVTNQTTRLPYTTIPPPSPHSSHSETDSVFDSSMSPARHSVNKEPQCRTQSSAETDSVFDSRISPVRHPVSKENQGRIRSSATSGFLSLSNSSLSSSENNMEMTSIHKPINAPMTPRSPAVQSFSNATPFKYPTPVIPSLLSSQPKILCPTLPSFPPEESQSNYENVEDDPSAEDTISFTL